MGRRLAEIAIYAQPDGTVYASLLLADGTHVDVGKIAGFATLQCLCERIATVVGKRSKLRARCEAPA